MITTWIGGIAAQRARMLLLAAAALATSTAMIGVILVFAALSGASMTRRALTDLPVDWQVAVVPGSDVAALTRTVAAAAPVTVSRTVGYAQVSGFQAVGDGTTQTTGAGQVLGLPPDYAGTFPGQIRPLVGRAAGVLIAQQTASNLHVTVGQTVSILRPGQTPVAVTIDGVVELPNADAMFQTIGPARGAGPTAPPDNVVLLPFDRWSSLFADAARTPGSGASLQIHAKLDHASLPASPDAAFTEADRLAKHAEVAAAGLIQVGDNLAGRLGAVREDALFAGILLAFLGLPGIVLSVLLSIAVVRSSSERRRHDVALLSLRGASVSTITRIVAAEGGLLALAGAMAGVVVAAALSTGVLGADLASPAVLSRLAAAFGAGLLVSFAAVLLPTLADLRGATVAAHRALLPAPREPLWRRAYLDLILLGIAGALFWRVAGTGYQIVLAPEGVAASSIDYTAFLVPLCLWVGAGLLVLRLATTGLAAARAQLGTLLKTFAGRLGVPIAASMIGQNGRIARGTALATLAVGFAVSVAIFAATYSVQAQVDARLTNGADVTVTGTAADPASDQIETIRRQTGVAAAEPMQHRFAYVGNDLQDLYGIDPASIGKATDIANAYFADNDARDTLAKLGHTPDGVLVSQETVNDFQLALGDTLTLRLHNRPGEPDRAVKFRFVGVVNEFPTAPHDSFLVANASYLAAQTGNVHAEVVLVRSSIDPAALGTHIREALGPLSRLKVTDLAQASRTIGSSLTAVDLHALTNIELVFAILLAAGATGLLLSLRLAERCAEAAALSALGASGAQVRYFAQAEAALVFVGGGLCGVALGEIVAFLLVKLLSGAFDPPPDVLQQPGAYLGLLLASSAAALWLAARLSWTKLR